MELRSDSDRIPCVPLPRVRESLGVRSTPTAPLLGPAFASQTPSDFYSYVLSLRQARETREKRVALKLVAKRLKAPTKAGPGTMLLKLGTAELRFAFTREKRISSARLTELAECLKCSPDYVRSVLVSKKFFVD